MVQFSALAHSASEMRCGYEFLSMHFVKAVLEQQPEGRHVCRRTSTMSPLMVTSTVTCPNSVAECFSNSKARQGDEGGAALSTYIVSKYDTQAT